MQNFEGRLGPRPLRERRRKHRGQLASARHSVEPAVARSQQTAHFFDEQQLGDAEVDSLEPLEVGDRDDLVDLVNRRVDRAELDDVDAVRRDEAAVGRAAARRQLRLEPRRFADGRLHGLREPARLREERLAGDAPADLVVDTELFEQRLDARRLAASWVQTFE